MWQFVFPFIQWLLDEHTSDSQQHGGPIPTVENLVGVWRTPFLIDLAATALKWYCENATFNDVFMVRLSGGGYMYPSHYPGVELGLYLTRLNEYMGRCDPCVCGSDQSWVFVLYGALFYAETLITSRKFISNHHCCVMD